MGKAKIGFEVDERDLANAKAFVAKNGGSLNKLVSALFASLGREETAHMPALDPSKKILMAVCIGNISIMEAARLLEVPDAGYVLRRMAEQGLPLPRLPDELVRQQVSDARVALDACLVEPDATDKKARIRSRRAVEA